MRTFLHSLPVRFLYGVLLLSCALVFSACDRSEPAAPTPPNIVLIIGDDHGYPDFGFMGSTTVATPNLDRLAAQGTVFSHAYVTASICAPSLRSLATGLHPIQHAMRIQQLAAQGVLRGLDEEMRDFDTLPRRLADAGYRGYQAGKFFGGRYDLAGFAQGTNEPGSDMRFGGPGRYTIGRETMAPVVDFFESVKSDADPSPFFLWFAPMLPHKPFNAADEFVDRYRDLGLPGQVRGYYANITRFDALVGEIIDALEARGLRENTLIVYLSDNGWEPVPTRGKDPSWDSDGPQGKRSMYELAFRTPLIFSWPGVVEEGARDEALVSTVDLFATLLDYGAADAVVARSGRSLRPYIEGQAAWSRDIVFAAMDNIRPAADRPATREDGQPESAAMARDARWYFIDYGDSRPVELFDMREDPSQTTNVATAHPEQVERMRVAVAGWKAQTRDEYRAAAARTTAPAR